MYYCNPEHPKKQSQLIIKPMNSRCLSEPEFQTLSQIKQIKSQEDLKEGHFNQKIQRQLTPNIIENGVFLKQKYSAISRSKQTVIKTKNVINNFSCDQLLIRKQNYGDKLKNNQCQSMINEKINKQASQSETQHLTKRIKLQDGFNEGHSNQIKKQRQVTPDIIENGIFLKQKYPAVSKITTQKAKKLVFESKLQIQSQLIRIKSSENLNEEKQNLTKNKKTTNLQNGIFMKQKYLTISRTRQPLCKTENINHLITDQLMKSKSNFGQKQKNKKCQSLITEKIKKQVQQISEIQYQSKKKIVNKNGKFLKSNDAFHKMIKPQLQRLKVTEFNPMHFELKQKSLSQQFKTFALCFQKERNGKFVQKLYQQNNLIVKLPNETKQRRKRNEKIILNVKVDQISAKSEVQRQVQINQKFNDHQMVVSQAITIQKYWRGHQTRKFIIQSMNLKQKQKQDNSDSHNLETKIPEQGVIGSIIDELSKYNQEQIEALTQILGNFRQNYRQRTEDKMIDQAAQTSQENIQEYTIDNKNQLSTEKKKNSPLEINQQGIQQKFIQQLIKVEEMSYNKNNDCKNISFKNEQFNKVELINQAELKFLYQTREQAINYRSNSQILHLDNYLKDKQITPKTYCQKKQSINQWAEREKDELIKLNHVLEKGQLYANKALQRAKRDILFVNKLNRNEFNLLVTNQSDTSAFQEISEKHVNDNQAFKHDFSNKLDSSDFQFSIPNSPKIGCLSPKYKSISISLKNPILQNLIEHNYRNNLPIEQIEQKQDINIDPPQSISIDTYLPLDEDQNITSKRIQVSPISIEEYDLYEATKEYIIDVGSVSPQRTISVFNSKEYGQNKKISNQQVEAVSMLILQQVIDECATECLDDLKLNTQLKLLLNKNILTESQLTFGIQTNLGIINEYIMNLCKFIQTNNSNSFQISMNNPYGQSPLRRLRQIHGYDNVENSFDSSQGQQLDKNKLYSLEEDLFLDYQCQNNNDENEIEIQEYQNIHDKAIFDAFNETLNVFRPFYLVNGMPYPWSYSPKHLTVIIINDINIPILFEKVKQKILEYASSLCGLIQDEENLMSFHIDLNSDQIKQVASETYEELKQIKQYEPNYMQAIQAIQQQDNDYVGQIREERLQKVLLQEINENEYKWYLQEDEKTEVLMEVTDYIFEDLIEEMLDEIQKISNLY